MKKLINLKPSELKPYLNNPRHNEAAVDRVVDSIRQFGFQTPILADENYLIIAGHTRWKAALKMQLEEVPVNITDELPEDKKRAYRIADNRLAEYAEWDQNLLLKEIEALPEIDWDSVGFNADDLQQLIDDIASQQEPAEGLTDDDAVPEEIETRCQPGDLWQLGEHRLLCGDATNLDDVEKLMDGKKADMVFTDPPYGVSYASKNEFLNTISPGNRIQVPIENDHRSQEEMSQLWHNSFTNIFIILKPGAVYYVTGPQGGDLLLLLLLALRDSGLLLKHMLIWAKNNHVLGRADYNYKHEPIIYGWKDGGHKFYGNASETSLWEIDKSYKSDLHPTMKPVELIIRAITNSSKVLETITDVFIGSGSTLIACEKTNRICYGMEIDPHYCDVTIQRWEDFTGKTAELIKSNKEAATA